MNVKEVCVSVCEVAGKVTETVCRLEVEFGQNSSHLIMSIDKL